MNPSDIDRPFEAILADCLERLDELDTLLGAIEPLSANETRRALKPHARGEVVIRELAAQCEAAAVDRIGTVSVEEMTLGFERAQRIRRAVDVADRVRAKLHASRFRADSESWRTALAVYGLLRSLGVCNADVAARLGTVVEMFRTRRRRVPR
jgi:hypothetical protein